MISSHARHFVAPEILPFDRRIVSKGVDIHAEYSSDEGQWQKDESNPTQAPEAFVEAKGLTSVSDGYSLVDLQGFLISVYADRWGRLI